MNGIPPGVLADILARLDALEQNPNTPNEALISNTYSVDASGNVNVTGINLPAGTTSTPPTQSRIRWLQQPGGAVAADLNAFSAAGVEELHVEATAISPGDTSNIILRALDNTGATQADVILTQAGGGAQRVSADAGTQGVAIIDGSGRSSFLQLAGTFLSAAGTGTLTWPAAGAFSNTNTITLPGASGTVHAIASPAGNINNPGFFDAAAGVSCFPGAGAVTFQTATNGGGAPGAAGTMTFAYIMWGI
jgi:hypothetical protein